MLRFLVLLFVGGLTACATSTAGLAKKAPSASFDGTKPAEEAAGCLTAALTGTNQMLKLGPDHWVVTRPNGYGIPVVRWDIFSTPGGNHVELHASFGINVGMAKARACAGAPAA